MKTCVAAFLCLSLIELSAGAASKDPVPSPPVRKVAVERRDLRHILPLSCVLAPRASATLAAPTEGFVRAVLVEVGAFVRRGQRLALVKPRRGGNPVPVVALFDGIVAVSTATPGMYTEPDREPLFTVIDSSVLLLDLAIPELDMPSVVAGQAVHVETQALPGRVFVGKVRALAPSIDASTRTFHASVELANPGRLLNPGMSVSARLVLTEHRNALAIPMAAVKSRDGQGEFVLRLDRGTAREVPIRLGIHEGDLVEVVHGLTPDDIVLIGTVHDGDSIAPSE